MKRLTGRHRGRQAAVIAALALPAVGWLAIAPASAALQRTSDEQTSTVGDAAEAWYAASPIDVCTTPLGCPPATVPTSPYPAETLHVGIAAGQETARTYVLPDLLNIPYGAKFVGGTMTLPVTTDQSAGTVSPDAAKIQACLAKAPITDGTQGSTQAPPATDCTTKELLKYDAKKATFTLDLTPFLTAWSSGKPQLGLALVPVTGTPTDAWQVSFNGRKYKGAHISSGVVFTVPPVAPVSTPSSKPAAAPANVTPPSTPNVSLPPPSTDTPPVAPPQVATPTVPAPVAQPVAVSQEFQYPLAFLLPIAMLGAAAFFIRLFTRDATPVRPAR